MDLDELDRAFQSGVIDERTPVLAAGALHWTTLGDVAGLGTPEQVVSTPSTSPAPRAALHGIDEQPNSIAPLAADIPSSNVVIPSFPTPTFDVSYGTEELRVFRPKRRIGRALAVVATVALVAGAGVGLKSYGVDRLEAKVASATAFVKSKAGESSRAAAGVQAPVAAPPQPVALPAKDVSPPTPRTAAVSPPPANAAESLPAVTPVESLPSVTTGAATVSVDSLPSAPPTAEKASKKHRGHKKKGAPAKAKSKTSSDPTQRGSGQFDPLNGAL